MADAKPVAVIAADIPVRSVTIYPPEFADALKGRSKAALGDLFGLNQFGVNLTTLEPGAASSERHWHRVEDELIYVLEGEVTLVDDSGAHLLRAGMCAGFKAGVANGHKLVNHGTVPARFLEIGTRSPEETATYPDVDMIGLKEGGKFRFVHRDGTPY